MITDKELENVGFGYPYQMKTTFAQDFAIADHFGISAIKDTFVRAFNDWKDNTVYLTELVIVMNDFLWMHYEKSKDNPTEDKIARLYDSLYKKAASYAESHLKGNDLTYYYRVTD